MTTAPASYLKDLDYSVLQQCMHCGMCLPTCPTYDATLMEKSSPRGRIALMRAVADKRLEVSREFAREMSFCLGCLACMTACPAGVNYAELFEMGRAEVERTGVSDGLFRRLIRWSLIEMAFCHPPILRLIGRLMWLYQVTGIQWIVRKFGLMALAPKRFRELEPLTPKVQARFSFDLIRETERPAGEPKRRVGMITGCVADFVFSHVNRDTVDVLLENGCEVFTPRGQACCGSLHGHNGEWEMAKRLARRNIDAFQPETLDAIIINAAGCGSHLKHYGHLLHDDPGYRSRAEDWDRKARDIHEFLVEINFKRPGAPASCCGHGGPGKVTYHEACHLCHGQKITQQPREILRAIPGLDLVELPESTWCCGSAGVYNITQPEMSGKLLRRKLGHIDGTGAGTVVTSNPGCTIQLETGIAASPRPDRPVVHPITLLAQAYRRGKRQGG